MIGFVQVFDQYGSFLSYVNTSGCPLYGPQVWPQLAVIENMTHFYRDLGWLEMEILWWRILAIIVLRFIDIYSSRWNSGIQGRGEMIKKKNQEKFLVRFNAFFIIKKIKIGIHKFLIIHKSVE